MTWGLSMSEAVGNEGSTISRTLLSTNIYFLYTEPCIIQAPLFEDTTRNYQQEFYINPFKTV
jgi:hypothetical protein